jgi:hypothetical protein
MERSSSSRNCTREHATWSSVLLGARKWIQKKKKKKECELYDDDQDDDSELRDMRVG